jgi:VWFA-related protein
MVVMFRSTTAIAAVLAFLPPAAAYQSAVDIQPRNLLTQRSGEGSDPQIHLRIDTSLVMIPLQATRADAPVMDLHGQDFRVYENGSEQNIRYFAQDDAPVSVGLLLDTSASMKGKSQKAAEAAAAFFKTANPKDEFFLIHFDESVRLEVPFTSDTEEIYKDISHTRPYGRTSLYDAVHMGLDVMKDAQYPRRALVILSDGGDNRSRRTFGVTKSRAMESSVPIYALGLFESAGEESPTQADTEGMELLKQLAVLTGGRHFPVQLADLSRMTESLGRLLRNEYVLGYQPSNDARDGTYRKITLEMSGPGEGPVDLRYRKGYYAPNR